MRDILLKKAHEQAVWVRKHAYAPYSKFKVGASIVTDDGRVFSGCNVENASYGATICAERNAICAAIADLGQPRFEFLVLVTEPQVTPCGICLQVIQEFCGPEFKMYFATETRINKEASLQDLLPMPFKSVNLEKSTK